jgi:hypothetical protein
MGTKKSHAPCEFMFFIFGPALLLCLSVRVSTFVKGSASPNRTFEFYCPVLLTRNWELLHVRGMVLLIGGFRASSCPEVLVEASSFPV